MSSLASSSALVSTQFKSCLQVCFFVSLFIVTLVSSFDYAIFKALYPVTLLFSVFDVWHFRHKHVFVSFSPVQSIPRVEYKKGMIMIISSRWQRPQKLS